MAELRSSNYVVGTYSNDTLSGDEKNDIIDGGAGDDVIDGQGGDDTLDGGEGADTLYGGDGNDSLIGGGGADMMIGGVGDDTFQLNDPADAIAENAGEGIDTVVTVLGEYTLGENLENLSVAVYDSHTANGNALGNEMSFLAASSGSTIVAFGHYGADGISFSAMAGTRQHHAYADGGTGDDVIYGIETSAEAELLGYRSANLLYGGVGDDVLVGGNRSVNQLFGGIGNDTYYVSSVSDTIVENEGEGYDIVYSSAGGAMAANIEEFILESGTGDLNAVGSAGHDVIVGNEGDNVIAGGSGNDWLDGGEGEDTADYSSATSSVRISLATQGAIDTLGAGMDTLLNIENIVGSSLADELHGDDNDNALMGGQGNDLLLDRAGNDSLYGGAGWDTLDGGAGNDLLHGGNGNDRAIYITAAAGITVSLALAGAQETSGAGIDTLVSIEDLTGSAFGDTLTGSAGDNQIFGDGGADQIYGGFGNDLLLGQGGDDVIEGQAGWDTLRGDDGNDTLIGGNGGDMLLGKDGIDMLSGDAGFDRIYGGSGGDVISGGADRDLLFGEAGDDIVNGDGGDDLVQGNNGDDTLDGGDGNDVVNGGAGNDTLLGGDGNDILIGNWGIDTMTGGAGADSFVFKSGHSGSYGHLADTILDFSRADGDIIDLSQIDAIAGGGDDAFAFIGDAAFSGTAGELRYTATQDGLMVEGDTDGDGVADLFIAVDGLTDLTMGDFVL